MSIKEKIGHMTCMLVTQKKNIEKKFVDYLDPFNFNATPLELKKILLTMQI